MVVVVVWVRRITPMFQVPRLVGLRRPGGLLRLGDPPRADVTGWRHPPRPLRCARSPGPSCEFMSIPRERLSLSGPSGPVPRRALPTVVGGPACPFLLQAAPSRGPKKGTETPPKPRIQIIQKGVPETVQNRAQNGASLAPKLVPQTLHKHRPGRSNWGSSS